MQRKDEKKILGKLPPELLLQGVLRYSGAERPDVVVGAGLGEDAAVIFLSSKVLVVSFCVNMRMPCT